MGTHRVRGNLALESVASDRSVETRSGPGELTRQGEALSGPPGAGGGSGAELDNSSKELGPAERLVELIPPLGDDAAWCTVTLGWGRVNTENQPLNLVQRVLYARPLRSLHLTSQQLFQDRIVIPIVLRRQLRPWMVR